ncbi:MAG: DedA family protein [Epsilonproteobacteria bacterium]|nr:DedA family protein [Campylobacterota bacterium]
METIINYIVELVADWGYMGIFIMMFLESTFFPIPSEVVMIPAGYLAYKDEMSLYLTIIIGSLGALGGASFNYFIAKRYGRELLLQFGKYIFFDEKKLHSIEAFFDKHGSFSTFTGRLIPGVRHFISIPAGLASMNLKKFALYTILGATIWSAVLMLLGYFLGENSELIHQYLKEITIITLIVLTLSTIVYIYFNKKRALQ